MKYVECKHTALVKAKYKGEDGKEMSVEFYPWNLNKYTGQPDHTGFTQISEDVYEALKKDSRVFNAFVKQNLLIVRDVLPSSAQTPATLIMAKDKEIAELKSRLAAAEAAASGKGGVKKADLDAALKKAGDAEAKLADTEKELEKALIEIEELKKAAAEKAEGSGEKPKEEEKGGGNDAPVQF